MRIIKLGAPSYALLAALAMPASAQQIGNADSTYADGILVTSKDVPNCPYRLIGVISINMRLDLGGGSQENIFHRLRYKAKAIGADAVVLATIGNGHITLWSWRQKNVTGRAIQYVDKACAPTN